MTSSPSNLNLCTSFMKYSNSLQASLSYLPIPALVNSVKTCEITFLQLWYYQVIHFVIPQGKIIKTALFLSYQVQPPLLHFRVHSLTSELSTGWPIILGNPSMGCKKFWSLAMGAEVWQGGVQTHMVVQKIGLKAILVLVSDGHSKIICLFFCSCCFLLWPLI